MRFSSSPIKPKPPSPKKPLGTALHGINFLAIILISSLIICAGGWAFTRVIVAYAETHERQHLLSMAYAGAATLDPEPIAMLQGTSWDADQEGYGQIRSQLIRIRKTNLNIRFIYIMALRKDKIVFLADAEPTDSPDYSTPGDIYHEASSALIANIATGKAFTEGPLKDRWGIWVSAIVPILSKKGLPIAAMGVDIHAGLFQKTINIYRWFGITITALLEIMVILFMVILHQVTRNQKTMGKANKELMESKKLFDSFMKNMPAYAFIKDSSGTYIYVNKAFDSIVKSGPEHRLGKTDDSIFPPDIASPLKANDETVLKTGIVFEGMETVEDNFGQSRTHLVIKFPVIIHDGSSFVGGIALDMTRQIETEKERDRLKNLLTSITDSMPSALMAVDTQMGILHWNREAEKKTGIRAEEVLGKTIEEILPMEEEFIGLVRKALGTNYVTSITSHIKQTQDGAIYEDITVYPLSSDYFQGIVVRIDNVTRRVNMERILIQSEKMVSIGGLATGMAHEINNPLAAMMQNAQVIMNRISMDLPVNKAVAIEAGTTISAIHDFMKKRDIPRFLESIQGAGAHAAKIVQNMLDFAQKDRSTKSIHKISFLLDKTIELAENDYNLKEKYDFRKIRIIKQYGPDPLEILCEAGNLQQVFYNIIRNAAEAMHSNPAFHDPPLLILNLTTDGNEVVIEIEDNGPGMDEKTRKRVFEPFFTTKSPDKGTGLGLSVSYFIIIQDHGGSMAVDSMLGKGSIFRIRLPLFKKLVEKCEL